MNWKHAAHISRSHTAGITVQSSEGRILSIFCTVNRGAEQVKTPPSVSRVPLDIWVHNLYQMSCYSFIWHKWPKANLTMFISYWTHHTTSIKHENYNWEPKCSLAICSVELCFSHSIWLKSDYSKSHAWISWNFQKRFTVTWTAITFNSILKVTASRVMK